MRKHYWQFLVSNQGTPISGATVTSYKAGNETTLAIMYDGESSPTVITSVTTNSKGYFEFWIDTDDYHIEQKFRVKWVQAGVASGYIDYVDIFNCPLEGVDVGDVNFTFNKVVSNFLANGWETHKDSDLLEADTPHNLMPVALDVLHTSEIDIANHSGYTDENKVVTDLVASIWMKHSRMKYDGTLYDYDSLNDGNTTPEYIHGIGPEAIASWLPRYAVSVAAASWTHNGDPHFVGDHYYYDVTHNFSTSFAGWVDAQLFDVATGTTLSCYTRALSDTDCRVIVSSAPPANGKIVVRA